MAGFTTYFGGHRLARRVTQSRKKTTGGFCQYVDGRDPAQPEGESHPGGVRLKRAGPRLGLSGAPVRTCISRWNYQAPNDASSIRNVKRTAEAGFIRPVVGPGRPGSACPNN